MRKSIWLYLQFPLLELEAAMLNQNNSSEEKPLAVVSLQKNTQRIICCNEVSQRWGVEARLSLSTALAICPDLVVLQKNQSQKKQLLQQLSLIAYRFSSEVVADTDGLWLEISNCGSLFKGYNNLLKSLYEQLLSQAVVVTNGIGESPLAAKLLCNNQFTEHLPDSNEIYDQLMSTELSKLPSTPRQQQNFKELGLQNVQDLINVPRSALSQRFNHDLMNTIGLLKGEKPFIKKRFKPLPIFHAQVQNPQGISSKESLLFPMKTLLQRFCCYLMARQCHSLQLVWEFEPLIGNSKTMELTLSGSNNNWSDLLTLSRLKLERLDLPQSIEKISLNSDQFIDMPGLSLDLFDDQITIAENSTRLIDNLNARLGASALSKPIISAEYLPENAGTIGPIDQDTYQNQVSSTSHKPLWLLSEPNPIEWSNQKLYWGKALTILSGPERLCGNWWQSEQQRDYYLTFDDSGARYWVFRELISNRWFVHGIFA